MPGIALIMIFFFKKNTGLEDCEGKACLQGAHLITGRVGCPVSELILHREAARAGVLPSGSHQLGLYSSHVGPGGVGPGDLLGPFPITE